MKDGAAFSPPEPVRVRLVGILIVLILVWLVRTFAS